MKKLVVFAIFIFTSLTSYSAGATGFVFRSEGVSLKEPPKESKGLKVFWWNIACSSTQGLKGLSEKQRIKFDPVNQWKNLENLITNDDLSPDVLILGEYCPSSFERKAGKRLYVQIKKKYKNIYSLKKTNSLFKIRNGLRVFSKYKIKVLKESVLKSGDFLKESYIQKCIEAGVKSSSKYLIQKFWDRMLIELQITKGDKNYKISPVHLANPWKFIKQCKGNLNAGFEILSGTLNPNYFQVSVLVDYFSEKESSILIGDFNAPKVFYFGQSGNSYAMLRDALGRSVIGSRDSTYFHQRGSFGPYSLDHAFVSEDLIVTYAEVIPFAGSDHLPLYIVVE